MKLATIFISILLLSALFMTACQERPVEPIVDKEPVAPTETPSEPVVEDVELVTEDEVDIGELI